ncbi:MAG: sugar isomerase domain-containing protein [Kiritimatiellaeota bacterium]|nr:sugar isomerase domain-containing protein [Kiritimatiellota bacterium]
MKYQDKYLNAVAEVAAFLDGNRAAIDAAAEAIATALAGGNAVWVSEVGHANQHDWVQRAGGIAAIRHFRFNVGVTDELPKKLMNRPRDAGDEAMDVGFENIRHAVRVSQMRGGDILMLGSVSGRSKNQVELALACQAKGVKVIGFTSLVYSKGVPSQHPSGKSLKDACDFVIDINAPYGDAAVQIKGYETALLPVSGVGALMAGWMIFEKALEIMAERNTPPAVFISYNRAGGETALEDTKRLCDERGY